jgi:hypothetical protein
MILLDAFRPDSWNFPLLLHVGGAAVFFGAVMLSAVTQLTAVRAPEPDVLRRVAFRTLLIVGLPAYIVFRLAAEWLISKEPDDFDPAWIGIGFIVSDIGGLLFLISLILAGIATRKRTGWVTKTSGVLSAIIVVALVIAVWAMGAKPT